eukprot:8492813-Pyramimonas_sp.AAC.1
MLSVVEAGEHGDAASDPVRLLLDAGQLDVHDEVGGVAGGAKDASAVARLVQRAVVVREGAQVLPPHGLHPDVGHAREQCLRLALLQQVLVVVPLAALDEEPAAVHAVGRGDEAVRGAVLDLVVELDHVDGELVLAREVLLGRRHEGVREEEAAHPEHHRRALREPLLEELAAVQHLLHVRRQRLQGREGLSQPQRRHLAHHQRLRHLQKK